MGVFERQDSPFYWMLLEGTGRKKESTGIRRDATAPQVRKANRLAAEQVYHARMTQLAKQRVGLPLDSKETFQPFSVWYETHHTDKHRGKVREQVILARLRKHFGPMKLTEIKPHAWTEYETARLKDGVSRNTIGRELAVMKSILNAAVGRHIEVSPLAHVKRHTDKVPPKRTITAADEKRLLKELHDPELHDLYVLGIGTLLRQMNLVNLQRREFDPKAKTVTVTTKTGPHRVSLDDPTVLQRRVYPLLKRRLPPAANGYFFPKWQARFAKDRNGANAKFLQAFRRACKRADIPWGLRQHGVVWHTATRASGATRMLREYRIDVRTVQLIGNWRSLDQMAEYLGIAQRLGTTREPNIDSGVNSRARS